MDPTFDTIVLGLGAMGSSAFYQLAKRGNKVLGIDQYCPPHIYGSSHGDTRIIRKSNGEGAQFVPLALRSYELISEIEKETGTKLLNKTGGLIISSLKETSRYHVEKFFDNTVEFAKKFNIEHELLNSKQMQERFPQFGVTRDTVAYYEPDAGILCPEQIIELQLQLAKSHGAEIRTNEKALKFEATDDMVRVITSKGQYTAKKLVIAAGSWLPELIHERYGQHFKITREIVHWFEAKESMTPFLAQNCPVFIWQIQHSDQAIYGIPALDPKHGFKIGTEALEVFQKSDLIDRDARPGEVKAMYDKLVAKSFPGISERYIKSGVCKFTCTPDSSFVIDKHPDHKNVVLVSACSGHGFKHSAAIGEISAQLVIDGQSKIDISKFRFNRFSRDQVPSTAGVIQRNVQSVDHPKPKL